MNNFSINQSNSIEPGTKKQMLTNILNHLTNSAGRHIYRHTQKQSDSYLSHAFTYTFTNSTYLEWETKRLLNCFVHLYSYTYRHRMRWPQQHLYAFRSHDLLSCLRTAASIIESNQINEYSKLQWIITFQSLVKSLHINTPKAIHITTVESLLYTHDNRAHIPSQSAQQNHAVANNLLLDVVHCQSFIEIHFWTHTHTCCSFHSVIACGHHSNLYN